MCLERASVLFPKMHHGFPCMKVILLNCIYNILGYLTVAYELHTLPTITEFRENNRLSATVLQSRYVLLSIRSL